MTPFDLVLVPFPFTDLSAAKFRPCLVLSSIHPVGLAAHYVVSMVTSQVAVARFPHDVIIREWREAGLPKPSLIRLAKMVTVEESVIRRRFGALRAEDANEVRRQFQRLFSSLLATKRAFPARNRSEHSERRPVEAGEAGEDRNIAAG